MYSLMDRVVKTPIDEEAIDRYWPVFYNKLKGIPAEEIVLKFISTELNSFLDYYKGSGDLNASQEKGGRDKGSPGKGRERESRPFNRNLNGELTRFFINLGENQNMNKGALVRMVCSETGIESTHIGRIEIHTRHSFFEIDQEVALSVLPKIESGTYEGKSFNVSVTQDKEPSNHKPYNKGKKKKKNY
jgi:ATP-dependent RNA helicase DeaD